MAVTEVKEIGNTIMREGYVWRRRCQWLVTVDNDFEDAWLVATAPFTDTWNTTGWNAGVDPGRANPLQWGRTTGGKTSPHVPWTDQTVWCQDIDVDYLNRDESLKAWIVTALYVDWRSRNKKWAQVENVNRGQTAIDTEIGDTFQWEQSSQLDSDDNTLENTAGIPIDPALVKQSTSTIIKRLLIFETDFSHTERDDYLGSVNNATWGAYPADTVRIARWTYDKEFGKNTGGTQETAYVCTIELEIDPVNKHKTRRPSIGSLEKTATATGKPKTTHQMLSVADDAGARSWGANFKLDANGDPVNEPGADQAQVQETQQLKRRNFTTLTTDIGLQPPNP